MPIEKKPIDVTKKLSELKRLETERQEDEKKL